MKKNVFKAIKFFKAFCWIIIFLWFGIIVYIFFSFSANDWFQLASKTQGAMISQKIFDILISKNPNESTYYFEKSVPYNKRGDYLTGFNILNKAIDLDPKSHLGYRGWLRLNKLKDYSGALQDFKTLDSLTPNFIDAAWGENIYYLKGICYLGLKEYSNASKEFNKYISSEKDSSWVNPNVFLYNGITKLKFEDHKNAVLNFRACIKYHKNCTEAYYYYGELLLKKKSLDSAKFMLNTAQNLISKGIKNKDVYNEVMYEIYLSDVEEKLKIIENMN